MGTRAENDLWGQVLSAGVTKEKPSNQNLAFLMQPDLTRSGTINSR